MRRLMFVALLELAGCLYVSSSGETDLRQGQFWNCTVRDAALRRSWRNIP